MLITTIAYTHAESPRTLGPLAWLMATDQADSKTHPWVDGEHSADWIRGQIRRRYVGVHFVCRMKTTGRPSAIQNTYVTKWYKMRYACYENFQPEVQSLGPIPLPRPNKPGGNWSSALSQWPTPALRNGAFYWEAEFPKQTHKNKRECWILKCILIQTRLHLLVIYRGVNMPLCYLTMLGNHVKNYWIHTKI